MAVPKKKRIGYRVLNRGSQFRGWHLLMLNLTLSSAPLSRLKRLVSISKASAAKKAALAPLLQPLPKFKLRLVSSKKRPARLVRLVKFRPFDKEACPFSTRLLTHQFEYRPFWNFSNLKENPAPALRASLVWRILTETSRQRQYQPLAPTPTTLNPQYLNFMVKRFFFTMQIPHKWGGQRGLLLKRWELSPSYFYLAFLPFRAPLSLSQGFLKLNHPTSLSTPQGPSLKELWAYIRANPNEGYWAYCMWLQITKKWKRWVRFPYQYFIKRNVWRRVYHKRFFYESLDGHRISFFKPGKVAIFSKLRAVFPLKGKLKKSSFSILTNFALLANSLRLLTPKGDQKSQQLKLLVLKSRLRRAKKLPLTLFRGIRSTLIFWFKRPL